MRILPLIVVAQFLCTTLWFVGNAVMPEVVAEFQLGELFFAHQTSAVQFGFIAGTLTFALLTIADRFSPSKVFFISGIGGALINLGVLSEANGAATLLVIRFATGFFLAGVYPVGMKIAADHFDKGLGKSLGFLVGALVLGTAFPHLLRGYLSGVPWQTIFVASSVLAVIGSTMIYLLVPDGPFRRAAGQMNMMASIKGFSNINFRSAAMGYFGHMWELYTFWAFVPLMLMTFAAAYPEEAWNVPVWSFIIIGCGGLACIGAGYLGVKLGPRKVAGVALSVSCACCLLSPLMFLMPPALFFSFLILWGASVVADSPMFSTLVAQHAPPEVRGSALTMVNCIGFFITIVSLQAAGILSHFTSFQYLFVFLAFGPILGLIALARGKEPS
ncbi:MAG: MFS transporter [Cyclobacteriaceae bacterium]|nr:MFS transporter [Cyclobacteriaceae bacterium]